MTDPREPRLVLRFAIASLVAFTLVGSAGLFSVTRYARAQAERVGTERALFVGSSILSPAVGGVDLAGPVTGAAYRSLDAIVRTRVLADGHTVRVKLWRPDGTIVFSDDSTLVGARFPEESSELHQVAAGHVESGVSDLQHAENARERNLADKLFFTYMPLRAEPDGPVVAVAELYQDYAFIQTDIDENVRRLALMLGIGLPMLYIALLPIALRASRELRRRNQRLNELLAHEQETVAELRDLNRKKEDFVADRVARAPHAAHVDHRLPLDAQAARARRGRGGAGRVPRRGRRSNQAPAPSDHEPAQCRPPGGGDEARGRRARRPRCARTSDRRRGSRRARPCGRRHPRQRSRRYRPRPDRGRAPQPARQRPQVLTSRYAR